MKALSKLNNKNPLTNTRPEIELLLSCVNPEINDATSAAIKTLVKQNIDWQYLTQTADRHGVLSLLYSRIKNICPEAVPELILKQWRYSFQSIAQRNLFLTSELINLLKLLKQENIVALPYKGPVLATLIYKNVALRRFGDLDIIVHKEDIQRVKAILNSQGFQAYLNLTEKQERIYLETQLGYDFTRRDGTFIEMHWKPIPTMFNFPIPCEQLWQELEPVNLGGITTLIPNAEILLLILCAHGSKDRWAQLKWICDLAELLQLHQNINWEKVIEQAKNLGCVRRLYLGLLLAHKLLNVDIPINILQKIKSDKVVLSLASQVNEWLFPEEINQSKFLAATRFQVGVLEKISDKLLFLFYFIITPISKEHWIEQTKLNSYLLPFYLRHPIRLLGSLLVDIRKKIL